MIMQWEIFYFLNWLHSTALLSCSDNYHVVVTDWTPLPPTYVCSNFSGADISCNDSRKWMVVVVDSEGISLS